MNYYLKWLLLLFLTVFLYSCGFQLKKNLLLPEPYTSVLVVAKQAKQVGSYVHHQLESQGVYLVDQLDKTTLVLQLQHETVQQRGLAIRNKESKAYEMTVSVNFSIADSQGKLIRESQLLTASQSYPYNSQQVLSSVNEENILQQELAKLISLKILNILNSL